MNYKLLNHKIEENIHIVEINRPEALNALNEELLIELESMITELEKDPTVRVMILTGSGKAFVAGADIAKMKTLNSVQAYEFSNLGQTIFGKIENSEIISIAALNGFALGGGLELALSCDIRIASTNAKVGLPEVSLGLIPGFGGTQRLVRLLGLGLAKEVILTGDMYSAQDAYNMRIVNRLVPPENLMETSMKIAKSIYSRGPLAVKMAKKVIHDGFDDSFAGGLYAEKNSFSTLFENPECKEGMGAFLEKRKPAF